MYIYYISMKTMTLVVVFCKKVQKLSKHTVLLLFIDQEHKKKKCFMVLQLSVGNSKKLCNIQYRPIQELSGDTYTTIIPLLQLFLLLCLFSFNSFEKYIVVFGRIQMSLMLLNGKLKNIFVFHLNSKKIGEGLVIYVY